MIRRWLIGKAMLLLAVVSVLTFTVIGGGRLAPARPYVYYWSLLPSQEPGIVALDVDRNVSVELMPQPPMPETFTGSWNHWSFSPDGRYIALENDFNLMRMDAYGRNQIWLTQDGSFIGKKAYDLPVWSPDGQYIAFMFLSNDNYEIYRMDADGSHQQQLTNSPLIDSSPSWSPDGSQIAFVGTQAIQVMDADGSNQRRLTHNAIDLEPSWSPDGQHILFMSYRDGYQKIYLMGADGDHEHRLTKNRDYETSPSWSPDGQYILFTNGVAIYVINADGSDQRLIRSIEGTVSWLSWSPDGQFIMFQMTETYTFIRHMYIMSADGSSLRTLPGWNLPLMTPLWFRP